MRKLIFGINISLDGCVDHTKFGGGDDTLNYFADLMTEAETLVYGRKTYELMVPYWSDRAKEGSGGLDAATHFAKTFDAVSNILVFSKTLERAEAKNTRIVSTDPAAEIRRLKQQPGKNILLGGVTLPSQLIAQGLVDEYRLMVHPVIAGEGTRLLEGISLVQSLQLTFVESKVFPSGCTALHYKAG